MRRWVAALAVSGLVAGGLSGAAGATEPVASDGVQPAGVLETASAPATSPRPDGGPQSPQLRRKGRWLVDQHGRVVIIHGLNLVWKHDPYVPPNTRDGFMVRDANWLARHGFNGARIGTLWAGLTPDRPGRADPAYLRRWQRVMDLLADRGIWMQLDAHQDQWHETYGGEGVPDWAMVRPAPFDLLPPVNAPFPLGYWTPEVSTVFDNFWANEHGLLDGWVAAWRVAARAWRDQPYLMGYDLINEPWMGLEWPGCFTGGCAASYRKELQPALDRATKAIRRIDRRNIVWWEPQQFAGATKVDTFFTAPKGERQLGFSWHNYCQAVFLESQGVPLADTESCWEHSTNRTEHALDQSRRMRAVPMMSEWGATDNLRAVEIDATVADRYLMGWMHWAYKYWDDPTTADNAQGLFHDDRDLGSVKRQKVRSLVRTYAQATAGTPLAMRFDKDTGTFRFRYRPDRRIQQPTEIFVSPLHYPRGWRARVTNGRVVERDGTSLHVRPTSRKPVTVRIVRR